MRSKREPSALQAIHPESQVLLRTHAVGTVKDIPKSRWPRTISNPEPEDVEVSPAGVNILTKAYLAGGWAYFVPRDKQVRLEPAGLYTSLGHKVYWHHPYEIAQLRGYRAATWVRRDIPSDAIACEDATRWFSRSIATLSRFSTSA